MLTTMLKAGFDIYQIATTDILYAEIRSLFLKECKRRSKTLERNFIFVKAKFMYICRVFAIIWKLKFI